MADQAMTAGNDSVPSVDQAGVLEKAELDEAAGGIGANCEQRPQNMSDGFGFWLVERSRPLKPGFRVPRARDDGHIARRGRWRSHR